MLKSEVAAAIVAHPQPPTHTIIFPWKSFSRSPVHQEQLPNQLEEEKRLIIKSPIINEGSCSRLTVWRKSLVISCKWFTVINSNGDLIYRVDSYMDRPEGLVLMDGSGHSILTMLRHKKLGLGESWLIYEGEADTKSSSTPSKKPTWYSRKNIGKNILASRHEESLLAKVFRGNASRKNTSRSFVIKGSVTRRSCKVLDDSRRPVAEVKRKEAMVGGASFGMEVFKLVVQPGFDHGIAMALVLLLDQMYS